MMECELFSDLKLVLWNRVYNFMIIVRFRSKPEVGSQSRP